MGDTQLGVMLDGDAYDLDDWVEAFAQPFDPYVEKHGIHYILRSDAFQVFDTPGDLYERASGQVDQLNGLMAVTHSARPVRLKGVAELGLGEITRQHLFAHLSVTEGRGKARAVGVALGPDGQPIPPAAPRPSNGQRWLALAEGDDNLGDLLVYHSRGADWFDIYKAIECMVRVFGGEKEFAEATGFTLTRIKLLKRTANMTRHARGMFGDPEKPMDRAEAYEMTGRMIRAVFIKLEEAASDAPAP